MTFSERLRLRDRLWWGHGPPGTPARAHGARLHRIKENHWLRRATDSEARWHCCEHWMRTLSNKWNAREFAVRHGCRVPELYWYGRWPGAIPIERLPDALVIRRVWGASAKQVYVFAEGREWLRHLTLSREELRRCVHRDFGGFSHVPFLVEEFVRTEAGALALPLEFKFYTFGDAIAAIEVVEGRGSPGTYRFFTPAWEQMPALIGKYLISSLPLAPPSCLDEMMAAARRLGSAYGTFVRVDFFATNKGAVFGEFSTIPHGASLFTAFGDDYLGAAWQRVLPDRL